MNSDATTLLNRFNRKAALLNDSRFLAAVRSGAGIKSIHAEIGKGAVVDHDLPELEQLHAYLLTLRLFDQRRDGISVAQVADLHAALPLSPELQKRARDIANHLAKYMASPTKLILEGYQPTRRELFDVLVYGGHAHANDDKEATFLKWAEDDFVRVLTEDEFIEIVAQMTQCIFWMRHVNLDALNELGGSGSAELTCPDA